jgi:elongation factor 3
MAPAATQASAVKSENAKSLKALEELFSRLTVSKAADEVISASHDIATFINGDIEEADAPTQYVMPQYVLETIY